MVKRKKLEYHMYADDTQTICFSTQDTSCPITKLEMCMDEIEKWMVQVA